MGSVNFVDIITDKIFSFNSKMKENFKPYTALSLMSDCYSYFNQEHHPIMLDFESDLFPLHQNSSEIFEKTKAEFLIKSSNNNHFSYNRFDSSSYLSNFLQDYIRLLSYNSVLSLTSNNLSFSHMLYNSPFLSKPDIRQTNLKMQVNSNMKMDDIPENLSSLMMTVSVKNTPIQEKQKNKNSGKPTCYSLNLELANRKTKELQKRSKKKRRRQKNRKFCDNLKSDKRAGKIDEMSSVHSSYVSSPDNKKEFELLLSIKHSEIPTTTSFVISVESLSDDDSDWDSNNEIDILTETEEFDFAGLLATNLSTTCAYSYLFSEFDLTNLDQNKDETYEYNKILMKVNKEWNDSYKEVDSHPKSPSKVSFAADDELVEILPVDICERKGEWEVYASERLRFQKRIGELEKIISPCLAPEHRLKMYNHLSKTIL